jgi:hypothetical protein
MQIRTFMQTMQIMQIRKLCKLKNQPLSERLMPSQNKIKRNPTLRRSPQG